MGMSADDHIDAASVRYECRIAYIFGCFTEGSHMTEAHYNVAFFCTQPVDLFLGNGIRLEVLGRQEVLIGDDTLRVTPEAEDTNPMAVGGQQLADAGHPSDDDSTPQKEMDFGTDDSEPEPISKVDDYQATYVAVPPSEVEDGRPVKALDEAVVESGERVARILFIYNDNTYEELTPRR